MGSHGRSSTSSTWKDAGVCLTLAAGQAPIPSISFSDILGWKPRDSPIFRYAGCLHLCPTPSSTRANSMLVWLLFSITIQRPNAPEPQIPRFAVRWIAADFEPEGGIGLNDRSEVVGALDGR